MLGAWAFVLVWVSWVILTNRKHHPKALFVLFFSELWERFSFYGMRALLTLYIVSGLLWGDERAYEIYGAYGALVYATPLLGGYLASRFLGYRKAILFGGTLMMLGHFTLAIEHPVAFFLALALLIMGNGFFKPNVSSFVGEFYGIKDPRRDEAFTLFYMGINIGAFLAPLTCGAVGEIEGWHWGFGLAGVGMLIGLLFFLWGIRKGIFQDKGLPPDAERLHQRVGLFTAEQWIYIGAILMLPLIAWLVNLGEQTGELVLFIGLLGWLSLLGVAFYPTIQALRDRWDGSWAHFKKIWREDESRIVRDRLLVLAILFVFTALFWAFFEQAGSSINLFTKRVVDRTVAGFELPASVFQSVNPLFIILLAPFFSALWHYLEQRNIDPPAPYKFVLGLVQLGLGFLLLGYSRYFTTPEGMVPLIFLIGAYFLHTTGELCLSPIGLSLVTKLSPKTIVGFVMGVWFISSAVAHAIGLFIAKLTALPAGTAASSGLQEALLTYTLVFERLGWVAIASGGLLLLLAPILTRWMHDE